MPLCNLWIDGHVVGGFLLLIMKMKQMDSIVFEVAVLASSD